MFAAVFVAVASPSFGLNINRPLKNEIAPDTLLLLLLLLLQSHPTLFSSTTTLYTNQKQTLTNRLLARADSSNDTM